MRIGVAGASGYAGGELLRLLAGHPSFKLTTVTAGSNAGELVTSIHPHLSHLGSLRFAPTNPDELSDLDLLFVALPHGESSKLIAAVSPRLKIVDLGADFRLSDSAAWERYYGGVHAGSWLYGLPELPGKRSEISMANRVANPGCYATAISLGAAPAVAAGVIDASDIVVVAASGTTGAGRNAKISLSASEVMNSLTSYKFGGVHQHTPEIEAALSSLTNSQVRLSFTPILAPMPRGILATVTARTTADSTAIRELYEGAYSNEPFVQLLPAGQLPETASVLGSNSAQLQVAVDTHTERLVVSIAIDNLGKGAAGQAIQNANLMMGIAEQSGLSAIGIGQ